MHASRFCQDLLAKTLDMAQDCLGRRYEEAFGRWAAVSCSLHPQKALAFFRPRHLSRALVRWGVETRLTAKRLVLQHASLTHCLLRGMGTWTVFAEKWGRRRRAHAKAVTFFEDRALGTTLQRMATHAKQQHVITVARRFVTARTTLRRLGQASSDGCAIGGTCTGTKVTGCFGDGAHARRGSRSRVPRMQFCVR